MTTATHDALDTLFDNHLIPTSVGAYTSAPYQYQTYKQAVGLRPARDDDGGGVPHHDHGGAMGPVIPIAAMQALYDLADEIDAIRTVLGI